MVLTGQGDDEVEEKVIEMLEYLPLLILLACPLMMVLMMRGMHGGQGSGHQDKASALPGPGLSTSQATADRVTELEHQVQSLRDQLGEQADKR